MQTSGYDIILSPYYNKHPELKDNDIYIEDNRKRLGMFDVTLPLIKLSTEVLVVFYTF